MPPRYDSTQLGYFLPFPLWRQAVALLDFQVKQKKNNRHYNTLDMFYYEKLGASVECLKQQDYFEQKVATNLYYGLEKEFAFYSYTSPKLGLGLRNLRLFSYPMCVLYYAVGLYLLKLSQEFFTDYAAKRIHIGSFYGGKLLFNRDALQITPTNTYFLHSYKTFRNRVRKQTSGVVENKIVVKIDIENFYDEISIPILLRYLTKWIKPSMQASMRFDDPTTRDQITFFFAFLSRGKLGIPQSPNNIISSFIAHLYMVFGDLLIDDEIGKNREQFEDYQIIRYVDDIYLAITFKDDTTQFARETIIESLMSRIADCFFSKLGLKFNPKTRLYWLNDNAQNDDLIATLKKVSPQYHMNDDDTDETPENKIANIFDELRKLQRLRIDRNFGYSQALEDEVFKGVFDNPVAQLLSRSDYNAEINDIFKDFNFDLVKAQPLEIIIIILKEPGSAHAFREFLLKKALPTTRDVDLIIKFLCQTGFSDVDLLKKLGEFPEMTSIMEAFLRPTISSTDPGCFKLSEAQCKDLAGQSHIVEQIRLRVYNERQGNYSVALNHLLNEIHGVSRLKDGKTLKKGNGYDANEVVNFLQFRNVPHDTCIAIRNLFDRRNTNLISHPGSSTIISRGVTSDEYNSYREHVGICLGLIL